MNSSSFICRFSYLLDWVGANFIKKNFCRDHKIFKYILWGISGNLKEKLCLLKMMYNPIYICVCVCVCVCVCMVWKNDLSYLKHK